MREASCPRPPYGTQAPSSGPAMFPAPAPSQTVSRKGSRRRGGGGQEARWEGLGKEACCGDHPEVRNQKRTGQVSWGISLGILVKSVRERRSPASTP